VALLRGRGAGGVSGHGVETAALCVGAVASYGEVKAVVAGA
jgi:hypothetical protein